MPINVSEAFVEIWKGNSQFGPRNIGVVEINFFRPVKETSHLSDQLNSTLPVNTYKGAEIF